MPLLGDATISSSPVSSVPLLQAYAKDISSAAETISIYCASNAIPHPSFSPEAPSVTIPSTAPLHVQEARQKLIASAAGIRQLATEPAEYLPNLAIHVRSTPPFIFTSLCERHMLLPLNEREIIDPMTCLHLCSIDLC